MAGMEAKARSRPNCTSTDLLTDDIHVESDMWCSLDEDSLVVPFWLKAVNFSKSHHRGGMSQGVVVWTGENTEEETSLLSVLAIVLAIAFLAGSLCRVWFERWRSVKLPTRSSAFASWERVTGESPTLPGKTPESKCDFLQLPESQSTGRQTQGLPGSGPGAG